MPIQKLFKSIFGGTDGQAGKRGSTTGDHAAKRDFSGPVPAEISEAAAKKAKRGLSREDKRLLQRIGSLDLRTVLQVGISDSNRSVSLIAAIAALSPETRLRYVAIDQFEMGGQSLSLRDYHKQVREVEASVQLIPMPISAGLGRVLSTVGQVDLIFWTVAGGESPQDNLEALQRLSKPETLLFTQGENGWSETRCQLMAGESRVA